MYAATIIGNANIVKILFSNSTLDIHFQHQGFTALWVACKNNNPQIIECLLNSQSIEIEFKEDFTEVCHTNTAILLGNENEFGCSPLWIAAMNGNYECLKLMIEYDVDVNHCTQKQVQYNCILFTLYTFCAYNKRQQLHCLLLV